MYATLLLVVAGVVTTQCAEKKRATADLQVLINRISKDGTPAVIAEIKPNEWRKTRYVGPNAKWEIEPTEYADKPFSARIWWHNAVHQTKIYPTKERAEMAEFEALKADESRRPPQWTAEFGYQGGSWKIEKLSILTEVTPRFAQTEEYSKKTPKGSPLKLWWDTLSAK